jgi:hypothetical protein
VHLRRLVGKRFAVQRRSQQKEYCAHQSAPFSSTFGRPVVEPIGLLLEQMANHPQPRHREPLLQCGHRNAMSLLLYQSRHVNKAAAVCGCLTRTNSTRSRLPQSLLDTGRDSSTPLCSLRRQLLVVRLTPLIQIVFLVQHGFRSSEERQLGSIWTRHERTSPSPQPEWKRGDLRIQSQQVSPEPRLSAR